jgi:CRISPR system Cascade subunit CasE
MYLTRMHLNPARRGTRHLLSSPQRMHAAVMCAFPPGTPVDGPEGRVLWRVDQERTAGLTLYVSSPGRPEMTHLIEQAGWPASEHTWQTVDTKPLLERLSAGQQWMFRVTANPVRSEPRPRGERGKRHGHVTVAQQEAWFTKRAEGWGFRIPRASGPYEAPALAVNGRQRVDFGRNSDGHQRKVTIDVATFDGTLEVTDPALLRHALSHGLGRAKAYGCGLLTLAPRS